MTKTLRWFTLLACCLPAPAQLLEFDLAQTKVEFTLADVLHTVEGTFQLKRGDIRIDAASGTVSGEIVVDAASGNSGSKARDSRMHANILESARYPEIVFRPDKLEGAIPREGTGSIRMHGIFRIHGADHEITLPADVEAGNGQYTATLHFVVPYVQWGMKNPSTLILRVSDKVNITVRTVARPGAISASRVEKVAQ
jgi:polyisoprenoid-binding protein YceI